MSLTRGKGLKQHDLTPFFRIPITVIRVDAVLLRDVKGCCCNAGGIGQGGTQIFAVADGCNVDGRKRQKWCWGSSLRTILHRRSNTTENGCVRRRF